MIFPQTELRPQRQRNMLLLNATARPFSVREFFAESTPPYAILSHTWGDGEVLFRDIQNGTCESKAGIGKVLGCCAMAASHGFEWVWIDTCCIDKSSSAELTEAINSMFQWYRKAEVCYVFLSDLHPGDTTRGMRQCRWFGRGWTLQELVAPRRVEFFDVDWNYLGSRKELSDLLGLSTGIPVPLLLGLKELSTYSVARRMSWAAQRKTTRVEDLAYCLLGIFGVNMPLLYGEGSKAFLRLQEEIIRRNNDMTIFAWRQPPVGDPKLKFDVTSILATSIAGFRDCGDIIRFRNDFDPMSLTSRGLLFSGDVPIRMVRPLFSPGQSQQYMVCTGHDTTVGDCSEGIVLAKIGPGVFCRCGSGRLLTLKAGPETRRATGHGIKVFQQLGALDRYTDFHVLTDLKDWGFQASWYRNEGIHVPDDPALTIEKAVPHRLWDITHRVFLRPKPYSWHSPVRQILGLLATYTILSRTFKVVIMCDYEINPPVCGIRLPDHCPQKLLRAFEVTNTVNSIPWHEVWDGDRGKRTGNRYVDLSFGGRKIKIRVFLGRADYEMSTDPAQPLTPRTRSPYAGDHSSLPLELSTYDIRLEVDEAG